MPALPTEYVLRLSTAGSRGDLLFRSLVIRCLWRVMLTLGYFLFFR